MVLKGLILNLRAVALENATRLATPLKGKKKWTITLKVSLFPPAIMNKLQRIVYDPTKEKLPVPVYVLAMYNDDDENELLIFGARGT